MKKTIILLLFLITNFITWGQSVSDQTQIMQRCIDLPNLQTYLPLDANGTIPSDTLRYNWTNPILNGTINLTAYLLRSS